MRDDLTPPQSLGPAQAALPWDEIQLAATGSNVGAAVAFCALGCAVLLLWVGAAMRKSSYPQAETRRNIEE